MTLTNGLFKHKECKTIFALCVDDFGVKYQPQQDLQHLIDTLKKRSRNIIIHHQYDRNILLIIGINQHMEKDCNGK